MILPVKGKLCVLFLLFAFRLFFVDDARSETFYYEYDQAGQLVTIALSGYNEAYVIDPAGNILSVSGIADPDGDEDGDDLSNLMETRQGTDPRDPDTDDDGLPDGWEYKHELDPRNPLDAALDSDNDGYTNLEEYLGGTDPQRENSYPIQFNPGPILQLLFKY